MNTNNERKNYKVTFQMNVDEKRFVDLTDRNPIEAKNGIYSWITSAKSQEKLVEICKEDEKMWNDTTKFSNLKVTFISVEAEN